MPPRQHHHTLCLHSRAISALSPYLPTLPATKHNPKHFPNSTPSQQPQQPQPRHFHGTFIPPGRGCSARDPSELPQGNERKGARRRLTDSGGEAAPSAKLDSSYFGAKGSPSATLYASNNCLSAQQLRPPAPSSSPHFPRRRGGKRKQQQKKTLQILEREAARNKRRGG